MVSVHKGTKCSYAIWDTIFACVLGFVANIGEQNTCGSKSFSHFHSFVPLVSFLSQLEAKIPTSLIILTETTIAHPPVMAPLGWAIVFCYFNLYRPSSHIGTSKCSTQSEVELPSTLMIDSISIQYHT